MTPERDLEHRPRDVVGGHGAQPDARGERRGDDERDLVRAQAQRPRRHEQQDLARLRIGQVDVEATAGNSPA